MTESRKPNAESRERIADCRKPILIIGIGSHQGDDAVAWEIIRRLAEAHPHLDLHAIDNGLALLDLLDPAGHCIIIDALQSLDCPGSLHRFTWPDDRLLAHPSWSSHGLGVTEALHLAETLGTLPRVVTVFGIEGASWQPSAGLTTPVAAQVDQIVEEILREVSGERKHGDEAT